ncbi:MAG: hypothetical protein LBG42_02655 [Treponema sp.]|jgi:nitrogenase iron protein NifH|nr:hypothetical protein [Treponema sp.]
MLVYFVPRDNIVQHAEIRKKTVIDFKTDSRQAEEYRNLARTVEENTDFAISKPISRKPQPAPAPHA